METKGHAATHVGRARENNEDRHLCNDELGLYMVSDGMGGHAGGEEAAKTACLSAERFVREAEERIRGVREGRLGHHELRSVVREALREACAEVYRRATSDPDLKGMGCTLTMLLIVGGRAAMAHVGDTRLYLVRDGRPGN